MKEFLERHGITLAIGGVAFAWLYSYRKYLGMLLLLTVTTCSYKADIYNYITTSRDQAHQERMAEIQAQTNQERLKVEGQIALEQTRAKAAADLQAQQLQAQEQARKDAAQAAKTRPQPAPRATPSSTSATSSNYKPTDASNLAIAVQNARAEQFRLVGVRDSLYTQYRTAQYYGNADDAKKYGEQVALYDSYIAQQAEIIRRLTTCGSYSVGACNL